MDITFRPSPQAAPLIIPLARSPPELMGRGRGEAGGKDGCEKVLYNVGAARRHIVRYTKLRARTLRRRLHSHVTSIVPAHLRVPGSGDPISGTNPFRARGTENVQNLTSGFVADSCEICNPLSQQYKMALKSACKCQLLLLSIYSCN